MSSLPWFTFPQPICWLADKIVTDFPQSPTVIHLHSVEVSNYFFQDELKCVGHCDGGGFSPNTYFSNEVCFLARLTKCQLRILCPPSIVWARCGRGMAKVRTKFCSVLNSWMKQPDSLLLSPNNRNTLATIPCHRASSSSLPPVLIAFISPSMAPGG